MDTYCVCIHLACVPMSPHQCAHLFTCGAHGIHTSRVITLMPRHRVYASTCCCIDVFLHSHVSALPHPHVFCVHTYAASQCVCVLAILHAHVSVSCLYAFTCPSDQVSMSWCLFIHVNTPAHLRLLIYMAVYLQAHVFTRYRE